MAKSTPRPVRDRKLPMGNRSTVLELARIYVASAAYAPALESLERLPTNGWDEEARLLRAEAMIGSGAVSKALELLGPVILPPPARGSSGDRPSRIPASGRGSRRLASSRRRHLDLWRFLLQLRGLHRNGESRRVMEIGRAYFDTVTDELSVDHARIAMVVAQAMLASSRPSDARELFEHVRDLYERLGSPEGLADALFAIGNTHLLDCHWDEADAIYQEVRYRYEELGFTEKALAASINLGVLRTKRGELVSGRLLLEQALRRVTQLGCMRRRQTVLLGLAMAEIRLGQETLARARLAEVIRHARREGSKRNLALGLEFAGELHLRADDPGAAKRQLHRALAVAEAIAPQGDIVFEVKRRLAEVALREGDVKGARTFASEAVLAAQRFGDAYEAAAAERVLAEIDLAEGAAREAGVRAEAASATLDRLGETFERAILSLTQLRIRHAGGGISTTRLERGLRAALGPSGRTGRCPIGRLARRYLEELEAPGRPRRPCRASAGPAVERSAFEGANSSAPAPEIQTHDLNEAASLGLVTRDASFLRVLGLARRVAELDVPIVMRGEPGSGCEILARLIHRWSGRSGPYIPLYCTGLGVSELRRDLFGEESGTGILSALPGGTLFLDEVSMLDRNAQDSLASWLSPSDPQTQVRPVRVVAAVRSRPREERPGQLRDSLFRAIGTVVLDLPPLRSRRADIIPQALAFLDSARRRSGLELPDPTAEQLVRWRNQPWPGNLRELRDAVERYVDRSGR